MEEIQIHLTSCDVQQIKMQVCGRLILHDYFFDYKHEFYSDETPADEVMPALKDVYRYRHEFGLKSAFNGVTFEYINKVDQWKITICLSGVADDLYIWFETKELAEPVFEKIIAWRFN